MGQFVREWHDARFYVYIVLALFFLAYKLLSNSKPTSHSDNHTNAGESLAKTASLQHRLQEGRLLDKNVQKSAAVLGRTDRRTRQVPKRIVGQRDKRQVSKIEACAGDELIHIQPIVFFSSISGTTEAAATKYVHERLDATESGPPNLRKPRAIDLSYIDYDEYFSAPPKSTPRSNTSESACRSFYIVLIPTYNIDTILNTFIERLQEIHYDFRIDTAPLSELAGYAVFGFGDQKGWPTEEVGFCSQALEIDKWLARLTGGKRAYPVGMGDTTGPASVERLREWGEGVDSVLKDLAEGKMVIQPDNSGNVLESDDEEGEQENLGLDRNSRAPRKGEIPTTSTEDVEDLKPSSGLPGRGGTGPLAIDFTTYRIAGAKNGTEDPKEMVPKSSPTYAALTKQGYYIVGSHSASKTCRWTKSALRGRGSCYKYSFYGIKSHLCMEATPSLSCSNKCVFCWRHGTNPVGTTWRWQVDPPDLVFAGIKEGHYRKMKEMRGVPGVRAERLEEAMTIRHCALSLVGEPIFYPHINELVSMLHAEHISTFLVCNAQHPDQLQALQRVTQLYVSIDASNRDSLRKIDRPLHRDFWERFCRCLDILREKRFEQRTVFRLTLVKGFNVEDEAEGYAALVERGLPCFVEIKGVTYCGTTASAGAGLTMQNVPFYDEVKEFVDALNAALHRRGLAYGVAAEHAHSCCILLASNRFRVQGRWQTTIDYDRFFELLAAGRPFAPEDYMAPTADFALFGNGGFNPADERVFRKGKKGISLSAQRVPPSVTAAVASTDSVSPVASVAPAVLASTNAELAF